MKRPFRHLPSKADLRCFNTVPGLGPRLLCDVSGSKCTRGGGDGMPVRETFYLHVAPDGDWWTGEEIFAAKHLQPDYVRSIPIPMDFDLDGWIESIGVGDRQGRTLRAVYDERRFPEGAVLRHTATLR